jgi:glucosamine--fructose-6-phosphate aminotransferase (isomerizing)
MCGIFGFIGAANCFEYGIYGLKQLQNRGYDSAGGCAIENDEFILKKYASTNEMDSIVRLEKDHNLFDGCNIGIFHTRWATHGGKTNKNAHPHVDNKNRISLVHNGIIENYYELKNELENDHGIVFKSETDTEVIVNLISVYYDTEKSMMNAIMKAIARLRGTWALAIICIDEPNNMYCARHGSSLLVGFSDNNDNDNENNNDESCYDYIMVTSEQAGFGHNAKKYICLNNGDITVIKKIDNKVYLKNIENYEQKNITVKNNELSPEPFQHWTIKEIHEQYDATIRAISFGGRMIDDRVILGGPMMHIDRLKKIDHLLLLGCGTSLNSAKHGISFFTDLCNFVTVQAFDGSEFDHGDIPKNCDNGNIAAIFLSQSGETKDLYRCVKICNDRNIFTIGVINVVDSLIAREVDCGCYLNAGREVGVASTKAFTSQVILLSMLAIFFAQINDINIDKRKHYINCLKQLPTDIRKTIEKSHDICEIISDKLITQPSMFVLGKGSMIHVASEGALKTKEIGYIHAEAYGGNALRHGPYAIINDGTPVIFISPNDEHFSSMNNTVEEVKSRNAYPIIISDVENTYDVSRHAYHCVLVSSNDIYKGILHNIPLQLIAYFMAVKKGHNPDMPKNLSKCVSV